jgi:hypothetical protein
MSLAESCSKCGAPAVKLLGTTPFCEECHYAFLEPIRLRLESIDRAQELRRAELLSPAWLRSDEGLPAYDRLSELSQRVWNATRGQTREPQSLEAWARALFDAITTDLITTDEAYEAIASHEHRSKKDPR